MLTISSFKLACVRLHVFIDACHGNSSVMLWHRPSHVLRFGSISLLFGPNSTTPQTGIDLVCEDGVPMPAAKFMRHHYHLRSGSIQPICGRYAVPRACPCTAFTCTPNWVKVIMHSMHLHVCKDPTHFQKSVTSGRHRAQRVFILLACTLHSLHESVG